MDGADEPPILAGTYEGDHSVEILLGSSQAVSRPETVMDTGADASLASHLPEQLKARAPQLTFPSSEFDTVARSGGVLRAVCW